MSEFVGIELIRVMRVIKKTDEEDGSPPGGHGAASENARVARVSLYGSRGSSREEEDGGDGRWMKVGRVARSFATVALESHKAAGGRTAAAAGSHCHSVGKEGHIKNYDGRRGGLGPHREGSLHECREGKKPSDRTRFGRGARMQSGGYWQSRAKWNLDPGRASESSEENQNMMDEFEELQVSDQLVMRSF